MKVKEESEKVGFKLNIQKTKIMASSPIISWQIDGEIVETVVDFIFWGFKITADGDCSHEIKRHLLLGRKVMTNLDNPDELWNQVRDIVQETGIKTILVEKKCKKAKWLSVEALQIAVKRRDKKKKNRHITLLTKVHLVKAMVFPVVMYGCEWDYKES